MNLPTYRGVLTGYTANPTEADVQTIQNHGGTIFDISGLPYSAFLPSPVTNQSQIPSSVFATLDTYAAWAQKYQIPIGFTFNSITDTTYGTTPAWMLDLAGGNGPQLELGYFNGDPKFDTVRTSIICLWQAIATRYKGNPNVIFDFFNEPFYTNITANQSNYRSLEANYSSVIAALVDAVRAIDPTRLIIVDMPYMVYYDINNGTIPLDVPRDIIWNAHAYCSPSVALDTGYNSWKHYYVDAFVNFFVTHLAKPLFIGEYSYFDNTQMQLDTYPGWQNIISGQVAYLKTLPLWGYAWSALPWLYGGMWNTYNKSLGFSTFTEVESEWILNTVLNAPTAPTHNLIITASIGGTTKPAPSPNPVTAPPTPYVYPAGTIVTVQAIPDSGYTFRKWLFDGADATQWWPGPQINITMDADHTVQAIFAAVVVSYVLDIWAMTGGTTQPTGTQTVASGTPVTITATPNAGYAFNGWLVNGQAASANPLQLTITAATTVIPQFQAIPTYTLTVITSTGGTTDPIAGTYSAQAGKVLPVKNIPGSGYQFKTWILDGADQDQWWHLAGTINITMNGNHSIQAVFEPIPTQPPSQAGGTTAFLLVIGGVTAAGLVLGLTSGKKQTQRRRRK